MYIEVMPNVDLYKVQVIVNMEKGFNGKKHSVTWNWQNVLER